MDFRDYLEQLPIDERGWSIGSAIRNAVAEGLTPFRLQGGLWIYNEFDIDFNRYVIIVEAVFTRQFRLAHKEYVNAFKFEEEAAKLPEKFFQAFRNSELWERPSHLYLGEN